MCCYYSTLKFIESFKVISLFNYQSSSLFAVVLFKRQLIHYITFELFCQQLFLFFRKSFFQMFTRKLNSGLSSSVFPKRQLNYISISSFVCQELFQLSKVCFLWLCESVSLSQSARLYYHPILRMSTAFFTIYDILFQNSIHCIFYRTYSDHLHAGKQVLALSYRCQ